VNSMSIHSEFNACMYKDECKSNETTVQDLQQRLALKDLEIMRVREALGVLVANDYKKISGFTAMENARKALSTTLQHADLDAYVEAQLGEPVAYIHRNEYDEYRLEPMDNFKITSIPRDLDIPLYAKKG